MDLFSDIRFIKGVGEERAKLFRALGVETVSDMLVIYGLKTKKDTLHVCWLFGIHSNQKKDRNGSQKKILLTMPMQWVWKLRRKYCDILRVLLSDFKNWN